MEAKCIRPDINGKACYSRIPIARKIIGTDSKDSELLISIGISEVSADLSYDLGTGIFSCDTTKAKTEGYCLSFSTTRLLQLLPVSFEYNNTTVGIMLYPVSTEWSGRNNLEGVVVDLKNRKEY